MKNRTSPEQNLEKLLGRGNLGDLAGLLQLLRRLWQTRQHETARQWQRTLPLGDYIVDRWEKARILGFGKGSSIYDSSLVIGDVTVGENTWIGPQTLLDGSGGLSIGANCSISAGVQIYSHDSIQWAVSGGQKPYEYASTSIGNNCYLGPNVVVSKGVTIGNCCIIGANSLVLDNIPDGSEAWGTPCKIQGCACSRFKDS